MNTAPSYCPACRKVTHQSEDLAIGHLLLLRNAGKSRERETGLQLHAYYCDLADGWHVGHDKKTQTEAA